jgi:hypothetical protein
VLRTQRNTRRDDNVDRGAAIRQVDDLDLTCPYFRRPSPFRQLGEQKTRQFREVAQEIIEPARTPSFEVANSSDLTGVNALLLKRYPRVSTVFERRADKTVAIS